MNFSCEVIKIVHLFDPKVGTTNAKSRPSLLGRSEFSFACFAFFLEVCLPIFCLPVHLAFFPFFFNPLITKWHVLNGESDFS